MNTEQRLPHAICFSGNHIWMHGYIEREETVSIMPTQNCCPNKLQLTHEEKQS